MNGFGESGGLIRGGSVMGFYERGLIRAHDDVW